MSERDDERPDEFRATGHDAGQDDVEPAEDRAPYDLLAYRADDALLDALGSPDPSATAADTELGALLLAWRKEADSEPVPELVDTDAALGVIASARAKTTRRRHRFLVPVATAAAVLAIAFTGVGLAAKGAAPGDTLWGLTKVLYAEHAESVEAAGVVRSDLDTARNAMRSGDFGVARNALDRAGQKLDAVSGDDGKNMLDTDRQSLLARLNDNRPTNPGGNPTTTNPDTSQSSSSSEPTVVNPPPGSSEPTDEPTSQPPPETSDPVDPPTESESQDPPGDGEGGSEPGDDPPPGDSEEPPLSNEDSTP